MQGDPALAVLVVTQNDPRALLDQHVRVKGRLMAVRAPGRKSFNRLHVTEIATNDWRYPTAGNADAARAEPSEEPAANPSTPTELTPEQMAELDNLFAKA